MTKEIQFIVHIAAVHHRSYQKRFYTREIVMGIRISLMAEISPSFFMIGWDDWIKKRLFIWVE